MPERKMSFSSTEQQNKKYTVQLHSLTHHNLTLENKVNKVWQWTSGLIQSSGRCQRASFVFLVILSHVKTFSNNSSKKKCLQTGTKHTLVSIDTFLLRTIVQGWIGVCCFNYTNVYATDHLRFRTFPAHFDSTHAGIHKEFMQNMTLATVQKPKGTCHGCTVHGYILPTPQTKNGVSFERSSALYHALKLPLTSICLV